jgi:hypothetical protein
MVPSDSPLSSAEEVEAAWREFGERVGFFERQRRGDLSTGLRQSRKTLQAYVSGGRWIAACPNCNDGVACWPENPKGCCLGCGTVYRIDHPSEDEIARAETTLAARPNPVTRSWHRHQGETIDELEAETEAHAADEPVPGVVALDDVARLLGKKALVKLRSEGVA